jgi:hypothetical protein
MTDSVDAQYRLAPTSAVGVPAFTAESVAALRALCDGRPAVA